MNLYQRPENFLVKFARKIIFFFRRFFIWSKDIHIDIKRGLAFLIVASVFLLFLIWKNYPDDDIAPVSLNIPSGEHNESVAEWVFVPGPLSVEKMKTKGCVADGILSEYGEDTENAVAMVNRSSCVYLHRALETWKSPPDFGKAREIMRKIEKPEIMYGMFIAEAIDKKAEFRYEEGERDFEFARMCRSGSDNVWGEHTCKPTFAKKEYRRYLKQITRQAMDLGIQSFLFGQIYYQDESRKDNEDLAEILDDMRGYAREKNMQIAIGAQTGDIIDEKYLRQFDYIEGGVGIGDDGKIEDGPCWSHLESCWALLWHEKYSQKANDVFLHLDWSGLKFDDMSVFARMEKKKRVETIKNLYGYFTSRDMGFLMPLMATINKENGGCYGPKKRFYSASEEYRCQDEHEINAILETAGK
ncbi:MAG: hypothetical protein QG620_552 [Patescibacteria group bacterium]|nr:hypothetical protein [Patescibacteria group bacterium]